MDQLSQPPPSVPHPRRRPTPQIVIIAVTAAVTAVLVAAGIVYLALPSETPTRALAGSVTITDVDPLATKFTWDTQKNRCAGAEEFTDVAEGASVVVSDERGKTLAVGRLGLGAPGELEGDIGEMSATTCTFLIGSAPVPVRDVYRVRVGRHPATTIAGRSVDRVRIRLGS